MDASVKTDMVEVFLSFNQDYFKTYEKEVLN